MVYNQWCLPAWRIMVHIVIIECIYIPITWILHICSKISSPFILFPGAALKWKLNHRFMQSLSSWLQHLKLKPSFLLIAGGKSIISFISFFNNVPYIAIQTMYKTNIDTYLQKTTIINETNSTKALNFSYCADKIYFFLVMYSYFV